MIDAGRKRSHAASWIESSLLRGLILAVAMAAPWTSVVCAAEPGIITSLRAIRSLSKAQAQSGLPVAFEATVTYYTGSGVDLFVQDDGQAIYVETKPYKDLAPGDRVLVRGTT